MKSLVPNYADTHGGPSSQPRVQVVTSVYEILYNRTVPHGAESIYSTVGRGDFDTLRSPAACCLVVVKLPLDSFWKFWLFCFVFTQLSYPAALAVCPLSSLSTLASSGLGYLGIEV